MTPDEHSILAGKHRKQKARPAGGKLGKLGKVEQQHFLCKRREEHQIAPAVSRALRCSVREGLGQSGRCPVWPPLSSATSCIPRKGSRHLFRDGGKVCDTVSRHSRGARLRLAMSAI
jgi:hypothetical protein